MWFVATSNSVAAISAPTRTIQVSNNADQLSDIYVVINWGAISSDVNYPNPDGESHYYAGLADEAHKIDVTDSAAKTGTAAYTLSLKKRSGIGTEQNPYTYTQDPSVDELTVAARTYTVTSTASDEAKIGNDVAACIVVSAQSSINNLRTLILLCVILRRNYPLQSYAGLGRTSLPSFSFRLVYGG